jgi:NAD(P) transhydrogenase
MSITNAISGITAVGGLLCLGGGVLPHTFPQALASLAVAVSSVNIFGGFLVTKRMLDMFKRPSDPPEHNYLYGIPAAATVGGVLAAHYSGLGSVYQMGYLAASLCAIGGISGLSNQKTARFGNALGLTGVSTGVVTALAQLNFPPALFAQALGLIGIFGLIGTYIGRKVAITELPQTVAIFHSLVGLAAVSTCVSNFMIDPNPDNIHKFASFFGTFIGGITFTGSLAAYAKLSGLKSMSSIALPGSRYLNFPLLAASAASLGVMVASPSASVGVSSLAVASLTSFAYGWNVTNSIGAADMPVAITVLNSYSGFALVAEGFMLANPMLTMIGSLIGSSGAILTYIMCKAMNRSMYNVIFGGYAQLGSPSGKKKDVLPHTETSVDQTGELFANSQDIVVVPGYGLAVAQG